MKIKRFEASSMSEALRKIKREFGEEAVILSAKTLKKSNLLGKKKAELVVVTAAIDRAPAEPATKPEELSVQAPAASVAAAKSETAGSHTALNILRRFNPITITGQKKVKPKLVQWMNNGAVEKKEHYIYDLMISQGVKEDIAADMQSQAESLIPWQVSGVHDYRSILSQLLEVNEIVDSSSVNTRKSRRILVMLGPAGVGKTSAVAKLAAEHTIRLKESVALVSLDNQRMVGRAELERYARILKIPLRTAFDADELQAVMEELTATELVIIDTPGLSSDDYVLSEKIHRMVAKLESPELYLLIGADLHERSMNRITRFFKSFDIHRLFFTRLDWAENIGAMINHAATFHLPIAYLSDNTKIPEGLKVAKAQELVARMLPEPQAVSRHTNEPSATVVQRPNAGRNKPYYVANRNSDIFHRHDCKSAKRINTANMAVFRDPAEAISSQFKPCRMCCSELVVPKPFERLARGYAAGNRY